MVRRSNLLFTNFCFNKMFCAWLRYHKEILQWVYNMTEKKDYISIIIIHYGFQQCWCTSVMQDKSGDKTGVKREGEMAVPTIHLRIRFPSHFSADKIQRWLSLWTAPESFHTWHFYRWAECHIVFVLKDFPWKHPVAHSNWMSWKGTQTSNGSSIESFEVFALSF